MTNWPDSTIISDPLRVPITAQKCEGGGVVLRGRRNYIALNDAEFDHLVAFVRNEARLMRYPVGSDM
jgi:hypothetical protein